MKMLSSCALLTLTIAPAAAPAIANAAPPPLEAYGDLPGVEDMAISPAGNLATLVQLAGARRVLALDPDGKVLLNAPAGDAKVRRLDWADDGILLVTNSATVSLGPDFTASKYELTGTIIVSVAQAKSQLVFAGNQSIRASRPPRAGSMAFASWAARR